LSKNELKAKRRYYLSKKELKALESLLAESWLKKLVGNLRSREVELAIFDNFEIIIVDKKPCLVRRHSLLFPTLRCLYSTNFSSYPAVIIDRGATLALTRGADLMAPGIKKVSSSFSSGEVIVAVDEKILKPVAVLQALMNSNEIEELIRVKGKGKVAKNIHRPNDIIWKASQSL
jgi:PUA-domain protein